MNWKCFVSCGVLFAMAGLLIAAPAPVQKTTRKRNTDDLTRMIGTWNLVESGRPWLNNGGRLAVIRRVGQTKINIEADKFQYMYQNGQDYLPSTTYTMKLTPYGSPKAIDLTMVSGDLTITLKGIYKLEGKKLIIVYVQTYESAARGIKMMDQERPTSFDNPSGNAMQLTLERD